MHIRYGCFMIVDEGKLKTELIIWMWCACIFLLGDADWISENILPTVKIHPSKFYEIKLILFHLNAITTAHKSTNLNSWQNIAHGLTFLKRPKSLEFLEHWQITSIFSGSIRPIFRVAVSLGTTSSWLFDPWCVDRFGVRGKPRNWTASSDRKIVYYCTFWVTKKESLTNFGSQKRVVRMPTTRKVD